MIWKDHSRDVPEGAHAFLGASKYSWLNYDEDKLAVAYTNYLAKERGTRLHAFAKECILLKQRLPKSKRTLNMYINDAIGFGMRPEQVLYFSENCFGTADAIHYKPGMLRIHDLKTGATPASMHQLEIYTALFCLEYGVKPTDFDIELRIYQNDEVIISSPEPDEILPIMDKIVIFDKRIEELKAEV